MEINGWDFLDWLGPDMSACVFRHLDDPADIIRATAVSRSWKKFVVGNSFLKNPCIRICPEVSYLVLNSRNDEGNHYIYAHLIQKLVSKDNMLGSCISKCIAASTTDHFPEERMENTLESEDVIGERLSYWSSIGEEENSNKNESLTYCLVSDLCIVDEIKIRPRLGTVYYGDPIFSAKFVRFKMGCSRFTDEPEESICKANKGLGDDDYGWTYISPEFPMQQENVLQSFKLPRPVLCIGGVVWIELIGRAQCCYIDNLYYICIGYVKVIGRPISRLALSIGVSETGIGDFLIQYSFLNHNRLIMP